MPKNKCPKKNLKLSRQVRARKNKKIKSLVTRAKRSRKRNTNLSKFWEKLPEKSGKIKPWKIGPRMTIAFFVEILEIKSMIRSLEVFSGDMLPSRWQGSSGIDEQVKLKATVLSHSRNRMTSWVHWSRWTGNMLATGRSK